jgi:opacity protein-like surface antigen
MKRAVLLATFLASLVSARPSLAQETPKPLSIVVPGVFGALVEQQGERGRMYVGEEPKTVTQFTDAGWYGTIGLLAHDYLTGQHFKKLKKGDAILLFYPGEGHTLVMEDWEVVLTFTLYLTPTFSSEDAFDAVYTNGGLVLQTCDGEGYFFVVAKRGSD